MSEADNQIPYVLVTHCLGKSKELILLNFRKNLVRSAENAELLSQLKPTNIKTVANNIIHVLRRSTEYYRTNVIHEQNGVVVSVFAGNNYSFIFTAFKK